MEKKVKMARVSVCLASGGLFFGCHLAFTLAVAQLTVICFWLEFCLKAIQDTSTLEQENRVMACLSFNKLSPSSEGFRALQFPFFLPLKVMSGISGEES